MALLDLATSPGERYDSLTVIGADGAAHAEDHRNVQLLYDRRGLQGMPLRGDAELGLLRAFAGGAHSAAAGRARRECGNRGDRRIAPHRRGGAGGPAVIPVIALGGARHCYFARTAAGGHPRFRLVAVADAPSAPAWSLARAHRLAAELQVPFEDDIDRAISRYRPQAACVSPSTSRHADLTEIACAAGLHVIQDKPMADTLADCTRIVRAVRRAGTRFLLWNRNGAPAIRQAHGLLEQRRAGHAAGDSRRLLLRQGCRAAHRRGACPAPPDPSWEPLGELSVEGIYPLAYLAHLVRSPVATVFARATSHFHQRHRDHGIEDLASLSLRLDDGVLASISLGRIGRASHPDLGEIALRLIGSDGSAVIAEPRPEVAVYRRGAAPSAFRHRRVDEDEAGFLLDDLARAIDTGGRTVCDEVDGWRIAATVHAALASARSGRVEPVPDIADVTNP